MCFTHFAWQLVVNDGPQVLGSGGGKKKTEKNES